MKRFLIAVATLALPVTVWAAVNQPVRPFTPKGPKPDLEALGSLKPNNPKEALQMHNDVLTERVERIQNNQNIPAKKKQQIIDQLTAESGWLKDKRAELEDATTNEERVRIRQEIIDHVHAVQAERRQTLADTVALPTQSPSVLAQQISDRFQKIAEQLETAGKDTTELDAALVQYQAAVTALDSSYGAVQTEKTVETLQDLRGAIKAIRAASEAVRNAVQSIIK